MQNFVLWHSSEKAIATHTIVLVIMMALFAIFSLFMFYKFSDITSIESTAATCAFKKIMYCTDWKVNNYGDEPWNWTDKPPAGCGEFGIDKPTKEDCEKML